MKAFGQVHRWCSNQTCYGYFSNVGRDKNKKMALFTLKITQQFLGISSLSTEFSSSSSSPATDWDRVDNQCELESSWEKDPLFEHDEEEDRDEEEDEDEDEEELDPLLEPEPVLTVSLATGSTVAAAASPLESWRACCCCCCCCFRCCCCSSRCCWRIRCWRLEVGRSSRKVEVIVLSQRVCER